ncbi:replication initiator [Nonomuraea jabiensis]|uniref:replication initiator n=1 Tax=Nonomuraea jabiensis TaxID=882448 RepID=UPI0036BE1BF0
MPRLSRPDLPILPTQAIQHAAKAVSAKAPAYADQPARVLRWGDQLDIRPITLDGDLTDQAVAGYIAKYATKAAECAGTLDRRINPLDDLTLYNLRDHARRRLGRTPPRRLGPHARLSMRTLSCSACSP